MEYACIGETEREGERVERAPSLARMALSLKGEEKNHVYIYIHIYLNDHQERPLECSDHRRRGILVSLSPAISSFA